MYEKIIKADLGADVRIIDLRTDTLSRPTQEMKEAMYIADLGDDVYGEDPTVTELERRSAELLGKEDALFLVSGTMANLITIMVQCSHRGSEIISGDKGHTCCLEQGGPAQIAGVQSSPIKNEDDGTFSLDVLREAINVNPNVFEPKTSLIIVENTHNLCGGVVLPLDWLEKVGDIAAEHNIPVHMDGARLINAAVYLRVSPKRVARDVDTVFFSLSKGLGCPVGAVLAGSNDFITKARRVRKVLGGGWRQAGVLAAAGLVALDTMIDRTKIDHEHALKIAKAIHQMKSNIFKVDLAKVQTNIILMYIDRSKVDLKQLQRRLQTVLDGDSVRASVRCSSLKSNCVRFVLYYEITAEDVQLACDKIQLVIKEYDEIFSLKNVIPQFK
ncbi:uncharacterized protein [Leptinotarsa decemlineata]|uniref:uncharacterized protein n=1 Tax=Leptinotarsa decemlineata TaxID=7539 RepID=UPI000C25514D|nr:probable low-specificity L-threonine aldolase 1 isoform X1 [Leptinotarsa decemlineata]XP_023014280.1 probable low-specificity L-threonine aldolase 1 isoform X2 [Leptinotarsa decemlineata]